MEIGKRVFDDGLRINEKTMVTVGDGCAFNPQTTIQPHSQEDGTFKSDRVAIGAGCTVGTGALIHYGATMGDEATLDPDSFLMKGAEVPADARWAMNPARELRPAHRELGIVRALTRIPRWTLDPVPGTGEHELAIPASLVARLWSLAAELEVPLGSVLAAAHARVLATLSGEPEVTTGYVPFADGPPLPILISTEPRSWRELVSEAHERRRMVSAEARFETVLDATGSDGGELPDGVVARVAAPQRDGRIVLRVVYRTEDLDRGAAGRIARYHLAALARMATDPDAEHSRQSLLSATELRHQVDGLAGPRRELPDRRLHELIEERVAANPHAVAAVHGGREWTYGELNARANRLARALLARRLRAEDVVAVVTERNLDWMAAVLAIFKAGGAYLPIEPQFPADRIATMLDRAGCRLVLTEQGSDAALNRALTSLPGSEALAIDAACAEGHAEGDLGIAVAADQLAYIYFTSGPRGRRRARCASTRECSTTSSRRSKTSGSARVRWLRRPPRSASTSRCGSSFPRSSSAGGR